MKATELRLTNLVYYNGNECSITGIDLITLRVSYWADDNKNSSIISIVDEQELTPIPLTEEWLLKFGFEKPANSWMCDKFHLTEWGEYPLNWCVAFNKNNAIIVEKLKYVHQLQNLYFALTGQELTIKQTV